MAACAGISIAGALASAKPPIVVAQFVFTSAPFRHCHASTLVELLRGTILSAWRGRAGASLSGAQGEPWTAGHYLSNSRVKPGPNLHGRKTIRRPRERPLVSRFTPQRQFVECVTHTRRPAGEILICPRVSGQTTVSCSEA